MQNKKPIPQSKTRSKGQRPGFLESHPFKLREHTLIPESMAKAMKLDWEIVGQVGDQQIDRFPRMEHNMVSAAPPSVAEEMRLAVAMRSAASKTDDVMTLARLAHDALAGLAMHARNGDGKALWQFAKLTGEATESLGDMTRAKPEAMRPLARLCARWPMMRSTHPLNCDPDDWLNQIELGLGYPVQLDQFSKWKPDHAATCAMRLLEHLQTLRAENPVIITGPPHRSRKRLADILPPFSTETAEQWWTLAEQFLLASYPKPETVAELDRIADKSKRRFPSTRRQSILTKIEARFFHIAR